MMKQRIPSIIFLMIFLIGLSLILYPTASDYWNQSRQTKMITTYVEDVSKIDPEIHDAMWAKAEDYNRNILNRANPFSLSSAEEKTYYDLLDIGGNGVMGYVEIPAINCFLPIYHGTDEGVLQVAIGHIDWTSLPVGGESTHCVISGHRGLPSAKLFTDLDKLVEGDTFAMTVLNEVLTYRVDQILIVEPEDVNALQIVEGKDYCTLVTCTPYGVNTHRLLVRGHRIANSEAQMIGITSDAIRIKPLIVASIVAVPLMILFVIWLIAGDNRKRKSSR